MTGRDLIIYILANGLEDKSIFEDGKLVGFMTIQEAAVKFNVGTATVKTWVDMGLMNSISIGDVIYIPVDAKSPSEKLAEVYKGVINAKSK